MVDEKCTTQFSAREDVRRHEFKQVWSRELDDVFSDVARYYDRANHVASFGLWNWLCNNFLSTIEVQRSQKVLDVCAGTNAIGIALLHKQPDLKIYAMDRSKAMQEVGRRSAARQGLHIESVIGDAHKLPFPDNHFDVVTLQYASRHLGVVEVFTEIKRVLKPGGHFYHSDMLCTENKLLESLYHIYLRVSLDVTAFLFNSSSASNKCKNYFISSLRMFYSADELSQLLRELGYQDISCQTFLGGMVGFHKSVKGRN